MKKKNSYKYEVGDIVNPKEGISFTPPGMPDKAYMKDLVVVFRFWDGNNVYVLNTQDNDICLVAVEDDLVETGTRMGFVEDEPNTAEEEPKEKPQFYLGYVYKVNKRLVAAGSIEEAIETFRLHQAHKNDTIDDVKLIDRDCALIKVQERNVEAIKG